MRFSTKKGFTLIELLVVISIIGVLASLVLSSLSNARASARDAERELDIKTIQTALELYNLDNGHYPFIGSNNAYSNSTNGSWGALETLLDTTLPVDPINENVNPYSGGYGYAYYSGTQSALCNLQAYMLVFNKERSNGDLVSEPNDGVTFCNNVFYNFGNTFVVGMDKDGKLN